MIRVGIIFGGASREREISFAGGRTVFDNLNKSVFEPVPLFLDSMGHLILLDWPYIYKGTIRDFYPPVAWQVSGNNRFQLYAEHLTGREVEWNEIVATVGRRVSWEELPGMIDVAFLALHGIQGEDGSMQGLLEMLGIPYTGSGILPSALGMNKAFQKNILRSTSFDKTAFFSVSREAWLSDDRAAMLERIRKEIGLPYVVRPANQGSSIGVSILEDDKPEAFESAMNKAFFMAVLTRAEWTSWSGEERVARISQLMDIKQDVGLPVRIGQDILHHPEDLLEYLDTAFAGNAASLLLESIYEESEVVVESFIKGREFSCVVIENENGEPVALPPTEIVKQDEVYDYRSKYLAGLSRKITPIDLEEAAIERIRQDCEALYRLLKFDVYARIDGFYRPDGSIVLNDPNTTSGMLPSSFFFHQAAEIGLNPSQFISYILYRSLKARQRQGGNTESLKALAARCIDGMASLQQPDTSRIRVAVIMGGYSTERHISVESGRNIYEKLSSSAKYDPFPVFLSKEGEELRFHVLPIHLLLKDNADDIKAKIGQLTTHPVVQGIRRATANAIRPFTRSDYHFYPEEISLAELRDRADVAFIALHGRPGEDGTLQQSLDTIGLPYNGSPPDSAGITIDKFRTKEILRESGFTVAGDHLVFKTDWTSDRAAAEKALLQAVSFPFIAKPVDDGCSSAVKKISDIETFRAFADTIFRERETIGEAEAKVLGLKRQEEFPQKGVILVEELIGPAGAKHFLEVTGGMLTHRQGDDSEIRFEGFEPSEALASEDILSLEEKFLAGQGQNITPARFDADPAVREAISRRVQDDLVRAAKLLGVEGYCRIDAFVRIYNPERVETVIIEVNALPGMTPATCIFHQAAINGYQPIDFIDKILTFALKKYQFETH